MNSADLKDKKILFVINNLGVGGAERLVVDDLNEALRQGASVRLLTLKNEKEPPFSLSSDCEIAKKDWRIINFGSLLNIVNWLKVVNYIREEKPDVIFSHLWFSNTIVRVACKALKMQNVIVFEQNVYDAVKTKKMFLIDRWLQGWGRKIVAVSFAVKNSLIKHGIKEKNIIVINNSIDISKYNKKSDIVLREKLGISKNAFVFLTVGRLISQKGIDVLLKAFARLQGNLFLLIAGQGSEEKKLKQLAVDLDIKEKVIFLGVRNDIPDILSICNIFVLASRYEGLPVAALEAMAAAKPVIVTNFEGGKDIIVSGENGLIVEMENVDALAEAMASLMSDDGLQSKLSQNAYKKAQDFSIQSHIEKILKV